jgi:hypothetical protein
MQRLEVSGAVRLIYKSLDVKGLIFFALFHDYSNLQMLAYIDAPLKNVCTPNLGITYATCHILGRKQTPSLN